MIETSEGENQKIFLKIESPYPPHIGKDETGADVLSFYETEFKRHVESERERGGRERDRLQLQLHALGAVTMILSGRRHL